MYLCSLHLLESLHRFSHKVFVDSSKAWQEASYLNQKGRKKEISNHLDNSKLFGEWLLVALLVNLVTRKVKIFRDVLNIL